jgi:acyl-[acyl-carrier-protein] desaturase
MPPWRQLELLTELEPVVGRELDRHLRAAREWFPHEYVPP